MKSADLMDLIATYELALEAERNDPRMRGLMLTYIRELPPMKRGAIEEYQLVKEAIAKEIASGFRS